MMDALMNRGDQQLHVEHHHHLFSLPSSSSISSSSIATPPLAAVLLLLIIIILSLTHPNLRSVLFVLYSYCMYYFYYSGRCKWIKIIIIDNIIEEKTCLP